MIARATRVAALAVALAILPGALGLVLPIEHSFDGRAFFKAGAIIFGDELLVKQRGVGTYERPALSAEEVQAARSAVERGGRYYVRVCDDSIPSAELPLASAPASAWAAANGSPSLSLSLLSLGGVGGVAIDRDAAAPEGGVGFPAESALRRPAATRSRLSFPEAGGVLRGGAAAAAPPPGAKGGAQPPVTAATREATASAAGASPRAGPLGGGADVEASAAPAEPTGAPRDESEMTPEEKKAAEQRRKKEEWEQKNWLEKNWMMLIPVGLMFLNRWLSGLAERGRGGGGGQAQGQPAAPARA